MRPIVSANAIWLLTLLVSCTPAQVPNECQTSELLLGRDDLPIGALLDDSSSPVAEYPAQSSGFTAIFHNDLLYQVVGRYSSSNHAARKYEERLRLYFGSDASEGAWRTPPQVTYASSVAEQYHVACAQISQGYQCRMIGQYGANYVFLFAYISSDGITLERFQNLLAKVDERMLHCLEVSAQTQK